MASSLIDTLNELGIILNRWIGPVIFILGIMGNLFNLMIFTRGIFLKLSCSLYFLTISINNLVMFSTGLLTRILEQGFQVKIFGGNSNIYCQIRTYLVYTLFAISNWFFVCASLDRFYSTNQSALQRQRFCSSHMAFKLICLTITGCILVHIHIIVYYDYVYQLNPYNQLALTCTGNNTVYNIFFSFFMLIFYSLLPPILMSIIGLLTLNNVRKSRQHINPFTNQTEIRRDKHHLLRSLSIQIIILVILTTPHSCYWVYMGVTTDRNSMKTNLTRAYEQFILNVVRLLLYVNYASSFYMQMIISKTLQEEVFKLIKNMKRHFRNLY